MLGTSTLAELPVATSPIVIIINSPGGGSGKRSRIRRVTEEDFRLIKLLERGIIPKKIIIEPTPEIEEVIDTFVEEISPVIFEQKKISKVQVQKLREIFNKYLQETNTPEINFDDINNIIERRQEEELIILLLYE
jgi:hypothetical protein